MSRICSGDHRGLQDQRGQRHLPVLGQQGEGGLSLAGSGGPGPVQGSPGSPSALGWALEIRTEQKIIITNKILSFTIGKSRAIEIYFSIHQQ